MQSDTPPNRKRLSSVSETGFPAKERLTRRRHGCPTQHLNLATGVRAENVFTRREDINFACGKFNN